MQIDFKELVPSRVTKHTLFKPFSEYDCVSGRNVIEYEVEFENEESASRLIMHYEQALSLIKAKI
jgi:hypothetical protein